MIHVPGPDLLRFLAPSITWCTQGQQAGQRRGTWGGRSCSRAGNTSEVRKSQSGGYAVYAVHAAAAWGRCESDARDQVA